MAKSDAISLYEAAKAIKTSLVNAGKKATVRSISTDTRTVGPAPLFGPWFDDYSFGGQSFEKWIRAKRQEMAGFLSSEGGK